MYQNSQDNYLKNQVMSASPNKLIEMLLEGAIKRIRMGKLAIENNNIVQASEQIIRAQDIIMELRYSINEEVDSQIPQDLIQLYEFMYDRLVIANMEKNTAILDEVQHLIAELTDAWKQISTNN
ncbi:flagellar export chaperone FliS [Candidatus Enterococcus willemsii]|uniref:Flagellar export chaperone FliS n=1 Tax=Candidatus Enterococcus willemsii TaxID=1857215 RepID=A0ABQ6YWH0_9ENTE|nr:flagellar export chaperone FliS [Enterococcus sp. CU12B]KAF1302044.1 flagellar export chaperone FliS [Enterococcus sp. CU12B]